MTIHYSKSAAGFFIDGISPSIPSDAVVISQEAWAHLLANQSATSQISSDADGNPVLVNPASGSAVIYTSAGVT